MLPEQIRHEEAITAAHHALVTARTRESRIACADLMRCLIRARDPDITRRLEAARLQRVGL
jgi:hypothetical protein